MSLFIRPELLLSCFLFCAQWKWLSLCLDHPIVTAVEVLCLSLFASLLFVLKTCQHRISATWPFFVLKLLTLSTEGHSSLGAEAKYRQV